MVDLSYSSIAGGFLFQSTICSRCICLLLPTLIRADTSMEHCYQVHHPLCTAIFHISTSIYCYYCPKSVRDCHMLYHVWTGCFSLKLDFNLGDIVSFPPWGSFILFPTFIWWYLTSSLDKISGIHPHTACLMTSDACLICTLGFWWWSVLDLVNQRFWDKVKYSKHWRGLSPNDSLKCLH